MSHHLNTTLIVLPSIHLLHNIVNIMLDTCKGITYWTNYKNLNSQAIHTVRDRDRKKDREWQTERERPRQTHRWTDTKRKYEMQTYAERNERERELPPPPPPCLLLFFTNTTNYPFLSSTTLLLRYIMHILIPQELTIPPPAMLMREEKMHEIIWSPTGNNSVEVWTFLTRELRPVSKDWYDECSWKWRQS